jgi:hypothetical protein
MSAEFPSLAEVLAKHLHNDEGGGHVWCSCESHAQFGQLEVISEATYLAHIERRWLEARTIRTVDQLDTLPPGAIVLTASPRLIPSSCIWIRDTSDEHGHWWNYRGDDSFTSADVLYEKPEIALLLHHPDWPVPQ